MRTQKWLKVTSVLATFLFVVVLPAPAQTPEVVSPGSSDRVAEIEGRCPSFFWGLVPGAERYELVGYRIPDSRDPADLDPSQAEQVLYTEVPGSATSWAPNLDQCLTPGGSFVWFVRAVFSEEDGEVLEASEWSEGKYFSISSRPSVEEVEEALDVLRRYSAREVTSGSTTAAPQRPEISQPKPKPPSFPRLHSASVPTAKTAIRAGVPDASGENYGIVGLSNSPNGAGLAGANTNGGPDLVLDGSADDPVDPDAVFTQAGIDRADSSDTSFSLLNSDPTGKLNLDVEGTLSADTATITNAASVGTDLEVGGILTAGNALIGAWPANATYTFFGHSSLDHSDFSNYALVQSSSGETFLNAKTDLRIRTSNTDRIFVNDSNTQLYGNLLVGGTIDVNDQAIHNVRELQLKDWDDDSGGSDSKYRLLARDGAWMFSNGGVIVGNYTDGTWTDVADGSLVVEGNIYGSLSLYTVTAGVSALVDDCATCDSGDQILSCMPSNLGDCSVNPCDADLYIDLENSRCCAVASASGGWLIRIVCLNGIP